MLTCCSFWQDVSTPKLYINVDAADNINPNSAGEPRPVELRIYQLSNDEAFNQASFVQLYTNPQDVLKSEILLERSLPSIFPGKHSIEMIPLASGVKYVGIVAGFSKSYAAKNKVIYKLNDLVGARIHVKVDGININLSSSHFEPIDLSEDPQ